MNMLIYGSPRRYIQGPGALENIGVELALIGKSAVVVGDQTVLNICGETVLNSAKSANVTVTVEVFSGEPTYSEIARISQNLGKIDIVVGLGGGKCLDAAKLASREIDAAFVSVPTIASNDSPTSHIAVVYDENHKMVAVEKMRQNPELVLVDTNVIVKAPLILLSAGIGDALVKYFEVRQCHNAGGANSFGGSAPISSLTLAKACYDTLREYQPGAYAAHAKGAPDAAFEAIVEACVLMSGLAFESGGVSVSHGMTRGLSAIPGAADALHGHQVAYGLLVQFVLEDRNDDFMEDMEGFYTAAGLPLTLAELGVKKVTPKIIDTISSLSAAAAHMKNFDKAIDAHSLAGAINQVERMFGDTNVN